MHQDPDRSDSSNLTTVERVSEFLQNIFRTAEGNVIHEHILEEARKRAVENGWAATEAAVTKQMLCDMLDIMEDEIKRQPKKYRDTDKRQKIITTKKGLDCKHSRQSNNSK